MEHTTFVGLDVHKKTTSVAIAEPGRAGEVRFMGEISSTPEALHRLVQRLEGRHRRLSFCYEAGPCGQVLWQDEAPPARAEVSRSIVMRLAGDGTFETTVEQALMRGLATA